MLMWYRETTALLEIHLLSWSSKLNSKLKYFIVHLKIYSFGSYVMNLYILALGQYVVPRGKDIYVLESRMWTSRIEDDVQLHPR